MTFNKLLPDVIASVSFLSFALSLALFVVTVIVVLPVPDSADTLSQLATPVTFHAIFALIAIDCDEPAVELKFTEETSLDKMPSAAFCLMVISFCKDPSVDFTCIVHVRAVAAVFSEILTTTPLLPLPD